MVPDRMKPEDRQRVTSAGGRARAAGDPDELRLTRQAAAAAVNSPIALARRLVRRFHGLDAAEQAAILEVLAEIFPVVPKPRRSRDNGQQPNS